jgi:hypothetical protein
VGALGEIRTVRGWADQGYENLLNSTNGCVYLSVDKCDCVQNVSTVCPRGREKHPAPIVEDVIEPQPVSDLAASWVAQHRNQGHRPYPNPTKENPERWECKCDPDAEWTAVWRILTPRQISQKFAHLSNVRRSSSPQQT